MSEYIERSAVWGKLEWDNDLGKWVVRYGCDIDDIPSADVAPVVHGRWVEKKRWGMGKWHMWLECSKCGHQDHNLDMYEDMPFTAPSNYCPNCGARMDGE